MELTGKCKEDFNNWICITVAKCSKNLCTFENFYRLNYAAKYGVLVDFFDSVGIDIEIYTTIHGFDFMIKTNIFKGYFETRAEARTAAIEKANEIHNNL